MEFSRKDLIYLDTETHSLEDPILIQLAYKRAHQAAVTHYFSTGGTKIDLKAMAVHHITEEMIAGLPSFESSPSKNQLANELQSSVLVAHNAAFDVDALRRRGVTVPHTICTLRMARYVYPALEQHKLQYLRYWMNAKPEGQDIRPHDAEGDILVLEAVFERLWSDFSLENPGLSDAELIAKMEDISSRPSVLYLCTFGKHKGQFWKDVPSDYLKWILEKSDFDDENVLWTAKHYLDLAQIPFTPKVGAQSYVCSYPTGVAVQTGFPGMGASASTSTVFKRGF